MSAVVRVPEGFVLMAVGSGEAKFSLLRPQSQSSRLYGSVLGNPQVMSVPRVVMLPLFSPLSWAATLTFVHLLFPLSLGAQITEGVKPTLSELEKFEDQPEGIDLEVVTESTGICSLL